MAINKVMRKGLFWFYLEKSDLHPQVTEEKEPPCMNLYQHDRKSLLFQVNFYNFASSIQEKNIERNFFRILKNFGLEKEILKNQFPPRLYWSVIVVGGVFSLWTALSIAFSKRYNLLKDGMWQLLILSTGSILWDRFTGWRGWSLEFVFPSLCLAELIFLFVIVRIQKLTVQDYMIYYILAGLAGVIPILLVATETVHMIIPSVICAGISFLFLVGLFIFKRKDISAELRKKLHL